MIIFHLSPLKATLNHMQEILTVTAGHAPLPLSSTFHLSSTPPLSYGYVNDMRMSNCPSLLGLVRLHPLFDALIDVRHNFFASNPTVNFSQI